MRDKDVAAVAVANECGEQKAPPPLIERLQTARPFVALGLTSGSLWDVVADGDSADEALRTARARIHAIAKGDARGGWARQSLPLEGLDVAIVRVEALRTIYPVTERVVAVALNETDRPVLRRER